MLLAESAVDGKQTSEEAQAQAPATTSSVQCLGKQVKAAFAVGLACTAQCRYSMVAVATRHSALS